MDVAEEQGVVIAEKEGGTGGEALEKHYEKKAYFCVDGQSRNGMEWGGVGGHGKT